MLAGAGRGAARIRNGYRNDEYHRVNVAFDFPGVELKVYRVRFISYLSLLEGYPLVPSHTSGHNPVQRL